MNKLLISLLFLPMMAYAQAGFIARADNPAAGQLSNHTICGGTGCLVDNRISTSTTTGFTSPEAISFIHFGGKDFNASPANGVYQIGDFEFGTGSFLSGDLVGTALFNVDQSYVKVSSGGQCGAFTNTGHCKVGFTLPSTNTLFVGVFEGRVTWETNLDNSHLIKGTVKGFVNGGTTAVFLGFTCLTAPDPSPFMSNGHLPIVSIDLEAF
jgi:hypothetical protein